MGAGEVQNAVAAAGETGMKTAIVVLPEIETALAQGNVSNIRVRCDQSLFRRVRTDDRPLLEAILSKLQFKFCESDSQFPQGSYVLDGAVDLAALQDMRRALYRSIGIDPGGVEPLPNSVKRDMPCADEQCGIIFSCLTEPSDSLPHELWYVVDASWYSSWERFARGDDDSGKLPPPIDNFSLVEKSTRQVICMPLTNVKAIPADAWNYLVNWYGVSRDSPVLRRRTALRPDGTRYVDIFCPVLRVFLRRTSDAADKDACEHCPVGEITVDRSCTIADIRSCIIDAVGKRDNRDVSGCSLSTRGASETEWRHVDLSSPKSLAVDVIFKDQALASTTCSPTAYVLVENAQETTTIPHQLTSSSFGPAAELNDRKEAQYPVPQQVGASIRSATSSGSSDKCHRVNGNLRTWLQELTVGALVDVYYDVHLGWLEGRVIQRREGKTSTDLPTFLVQQRPGGLEDVVWSCDTPCAQKPVPGLLAPPYSHVFDWRSALQQNTQFEFKVQDGTFYECEENSARLHYHESTKEWWVSDSLPRNQLQAHGYFRSFEAGPNFPPLTTADSTCWGLWIFRDCDNFQRNVTGIQVTAEAEDGAPDSVRITVSDEVKQHFAAERVALPSLQDGLHKLGGLFKFRTESEFRKGKVVSVKNGKLQFVQILSPHCMGLCEEDSTVQSISLDSDDIRELQEVSALRRPGFASAVTENLRDHDIAIAGLPNIGNTCFMNAVLQCLLSVPSLVPHFCDHKFNHNGVTGGVFARAFAELLRQYVRVGSLRGVDGDALVVPMEVLERFQTVLCQFKPQFYGGREQGSEEFLLELLDLMQRDADTPFVSAKLPQAPRPTAAKSSYVTKTFGVEIASQHECCVCKSSSFLEPVVWYTVRCDLPPKSVDVVVHPASMSGQLDSQEASSIEPILLAFPRRDDRPEPSDQSSSSSPSLDLLPPLWKPVQRKAAGLLGSQQATTSLQAVELRVPSQPNNVCMKVSSTLTSPPHWCCGSPPTTISLEDCLQRVIEAQRVDLHCDSCGAGKFNKRDIIGKVGSTVCFQLQRTDPLGKNMAIVKFPFELDMTPYVDPRSHSSSLQYNLVGVVHHVGAINSGHYIAFARRGDKWLLFNDADVKVVQDAEDVRYPNTINGVSTPYLLFYEQQELQQRDSSSNKCEAAVSPSPLASTCDTSSSSLRSDVCNLPAYHSHRTEPRHCNCNGQHAACLPEKPESSFTVTLQLHDRSGRSIAEALRKRGLKLRQLIIAQVSERNTVEKILYDGSSCVNERLQRGTAIAYELPVPFDRHSQLLLEARFFDAKSVLSVNSVKGSSPLNAVHRATNKACMLVPVDRWASAKSLSCRLTQLYSRYVKMSEVSTSAVAKEKRKALSHLSASGAVAKKLKSGFLQSDSNVFGKWSVVVDVSPRIMLDKRTQFLLPNPFRRFSPSIHYFRCWTPANWNRGDRVAVAIPIPLVFEQVKVQDEIKHFADVTWTKIVELTVCDCLKDHDVDVLYIPCSKKFSTNALDNRTTVDTTALVAYPYLLADNCSATHGDQLPIADPFGKPSAMGLLVVPVDWNGKDRVVGHFQEPIVRLRKLKEMGFDNKLECIQCLLAANGSVPQACEILFNRQSG